jgi:predicted DsbA family dithiol-disulfide isomerase
MEEFSSYQCGFCAKYFRESFGQVMENYVETGQVLYIFRDFPLPGQPQSLLAAEAANCAGKTGDGGTYWAMHDVLFARQAEWSGRANAEAIFAGYAAEIGLDEAAFDECIDSGATRNLADVDVAEALARGVRGTPTFFVGGQLLVGAQPYAIIAASIDAALDAAVAERTQVGAEIELAAASALVPDLQDLPQHVQTAYRFALANPDVLEVIPCYCGCNQIGHRNNRMCYVESETADGQIVFDGHAVT